MSIVIAKKDLKNPDKLRERKEYLKSLMCQPRSNEGPSSQEWVSNEYYSGHMNILADEVKEIDKLLKKLERK